MKYLKNTSYFYDSLFFVPKWVTLAMSQQEEQEG